MVTAAMLAALLTFDLANQLLTFSKKYAMLLRYREVGVIRFMAMSPSWFT